MSIHEFFVTAAPWLVWSVALIIGVVRLNRCRGRLARLEKRYAALLDKTGWREENGP